MCLCIDYILARCERNYHNHYNETYSNMLHELTQTKWYILERSKKQFNNITSKH